MKLDKNDVRFPIKRKKFLGLGVEYIGWKIRIKRTSDTKPWHVSIIDAKEKTVMLHPINLKFLSLNTATVRAESFLHRMHCFISRDEVQYGRLR